MNANFRYMKEYKTVYDEYRGICKKITKLIEKIHIAKECRNACFLFLKTNHYTDKNEFRLATKRTIHMFYKTNKELSELNNEHIKLSEISREYKQKLRKLSK